MATAAASRGTRERYLQWFEPTQTYRFRRAVPINLRPVIGQSEWTETLSRNYDEAKRHVEELHRKHVKAGESFGAAYLVGFFDSIPDMEKVYDRYKGKKGIAVKEGKFSLN